jgi:glycosyltransferase involved in cell wall biosynthesis
MSGRYRIVYLYFSGGAFRNGTILRLFEPLLLRLAGIKTVVLPFGADVQDLAFSKNLHFVHRMARSYPTHRFFQQRIRRSLRAWSLMGDYIVAGCDWVEYMFYWDRLCLSHFAIDMSAWRSDGHPEDAADRDIVVLHAPNHREIKGTDVVISAVDALRAEGHPIRLRLLEGVPNSEIRNAIQGADIVVDQLVIGWYAMFSIEAMACGKPTICYLRPELLDFYRGERLLDADEPPLINAHLSDMKSVLRRCLQDMAATRTMGRRGVSYVEKNHSLRAIGAMFGEINRALGVEPGIVIRNSDETILETHR